MFFRQGRLASPPTAHGRNRSILVTAFTHRCFANWEPLFRDLREEGCAIHTALFPRVSDPDHAGLYDLDFANVALCRIGGDFAPVDRSERAVLADLARWVGAERPALVFMCSFHGGPEARLRQALAALPERPLVVGLQHGMSHDWPTFEAMADRFDVFGSFGRLFLDQCSDRFRRKMVVLGLPKLDDIVRRPRTGGIRRVLFAGQNEPEPKRLGQLLRGIADRFAAEVVIRPHPEHRDAFRPLLALFPVEPPVVPLARALDRADAMITTGSTAALEGLAAGMRVAVLPCQRGDVYRPAGIVAESLDAADVAAVLARYDDPAFRARVARFLEAASGAAEGGRTARAAAAVGQLMAQQAA